MQLYNFVDVYHSTGIREFMRASLIVFILILICRDISNVWNTEKKRVLDSLFEVKPDHIEFFSGDIYSALENPVA